MRENKSTKWSVGLKFVQWEINISKHETIKSNPFKVTFGEETKVGLNSTLPLGREFGKAIASGK